jgi:hypothetical protein
MEERSVKKEAILLSLTCGALLSVVAGPSYAQCAQTSNTCMADIDGVREGRHTADASADAVLWPPNHKFRTTRISASNSCGHACDVTIKDVTQDEPITGMGSGNFAPDAANCSNGGNISSIDLRGERAGTAGDSESGFGTGRYYKVAYTMHDPDFPLQDASATASILVPHDQGKVHLDTWVDEGPLFGSDGSNDQMVTCSN